MTETRKRRLANDYRELSSMRGPVMDFRPLVGTPPYVEQYELTFHIRSVIGPEPTYRGVHVVRLALPAGYPLDGFPQVSMVTRPFVYHPNWFRNGSWCFGNASKHTEGLGNFVVRLMQTLQYADSIINVESPANGEATAWYTRHKGSRIFPTDTQKLPQPHVGGIVIHNRSDGKP